VHHMVMALLLAVPFGYVFCQMDSFARRLHTVAVRRLETVPDSGLTWALGFGIFGGLIWSWVRYAITYAAVMAGGTYVWAWATGYPIPVWATEGLTVAAYLFPIAGLGVAMELFLTEEPDRRLPSLRGFKSRS
jgi:mannose/fructose/N-acetylgalactosamine-specific phosphotransferase system component IIC